MELKEHIVKEGVYIPETGIDYPADPHKVILPKTKIRTVTVDENYPYIDKSFKARFMSSLVYLGIFTIVYLIHPLVHGLRIKGRENIRKNKKLFKNGAMTVSNHVYRWDFLAVLQASGFHRAWFPALAENLETKDQFFIRSTGGIPIPASIKAIKNFNEAFDEIHAKKKWIHVFPEACRWDYYEPIRPFEKGAFTMAYRYELPVIPMVISYRKPTGLYKLFGRKNPLITITVGEPIIPDMEKKRKECCAEMLEKCHKKMVEMAGIEQNMWPATDSAGL
ncbi:MAG: 1-acyl-sn-glycerol-3-phosphate acyltransferase [Treponemataceae bacterium]|nr:1-acyl-sn-glycerol-3-phosphate acyltransferase [Treponemataceae bacterium]